jgi:hypothetical protein
MSLYQSPKVTTDGLVFYYDMNNNAKSWKGKVTTNYIPNPNASWNGSAFVLGYNYANLGATYTYRTDVPNPVNAPGVLEYFTGTTGYKYFSIDSTTVPTTGTYTFSYYARITNTTSNNVNNSQLWRANGSDRSVTGDWNPAYTSTWKRFSTTGPIEAGTILQYFPIHGSSITGGYTIQFCGFQLELGSIASPFVEGARSTSTAVLDLTGRRTIDVGGSPTYNSDGSFTFNSAGSTTLNLGTGANFLPMPSLTLEAWIKTPGLGSGMSVNGIWGFTYGIRFNAASNGSVYFIIGTDTTTFVNVSTSGVNVNDNNWHHVVAVKNGDASCAIYVDGILRGSNVPVAGWSGTNPWFAMDIQVGRDQNDAPYYFNGKIDIGRVYNRGLTSAEVQQNFNAQRARYI